MWDGNIQTQVEKGSTIEFGVKETLLTGLTKSCVKRAEREDEKRTVLTTYAG